MENAEQIIKALTDQEIVERYSRWYFASSFGWTLLGAMVLSLAGYLWQKTFVCHGEVSGDYVSPTRLIALGIGAIGFLLIFWNFPTLLNPTARAIRQLLRDIKP